MLLVVWVGACVPFAWVMVVGEGCSGWCCFQCCVAVVWASRRVPGVGVGVCVLVCSGVGWLVPGVGGAKACVAGLVCVVWFRMLTCLASFFFLVLSFVLSCCLVNNGLPWVWAGFGAGWWLARVFLACSGVFLFVW